MWISGRWATLFALASAVLGCGQTSRDSQKSSAKEPACDDTVPVRPLARLTGEVLSPKLAPCGELTYRDGDQQLLTDTSLQNPRVLTDAEDGSLRFDPLGRGVVYQRGAAPGDELVHLGLREGPSWSVPLSSKPDAVPASFDFYWHADDAIFFACQGSELRVFPGGPAHERVVQLGGSCFGAFSSMADGLLVERSPPFASIDIHTGHETPLPQASVCGADECSTRLVGRVLEVTRCNQVPAGDTFMCVGPPTSHYDARTDALLPEAPLITPDRRIVTVSKGQFAYVAPDFTSALTFETDYSAERTIAHYYGPNPEHPQSWLQASARIATSAALLPIFADNAERIALRSAGCNGYPPNPDALTLLFTPGAGVEPIEVPGCLSQVHWVGRDGTLLATLVPTVSTTGLYEEQLVVIHPYQSITRVETRPQDIRNVMSDGVVLATPYFGETNGLLLIDIATGRTELKDVEPATNLLVDRSHRRLVFEARVAGDPQHTELWAGAFPRLAAAP
jgi:hypothetical protein